MSDLERQLESHYWGGDPMQGDGGFERTHWKRPFHPRFGGDFKRLSYLHYGDEASASGTSSSDNLQIDYEKRALDYVVSATGAALLRWWVLRVPVDVGSVLSLAGPAGLLIGQFAGEKLVPLVTKDLDTDITSELGNGLGKLALPGAIAANDYIMAQLLPVLGGFVFVFIAGRGTVSDAVAMTIGSAGALALYNRFL